MLLSGGLPFDAGEDNECETLQLVTAGANDSFADDKERWAGVSEEAKALVKALLQLEAYRRPTAEQVLKHPWRVSRHSSPLVPLHHHPPA